MASISPTLLSIGFTAQNNFRHDSLLECFSAYNVGAIPGNVEAADGSFAAFPQFHWNPGLLFARL
jgi:hypothetical protein